MEHTNNPKNKTNISQTIIIIILLIIIGVGYGDYLTLQRRIQSEYLKGYKQGANDMKQSFEEDLFYLKYMQQQLEKQK